MATVFIGIGSNLGDRLKNCEAAVERLIQDGVAKSVIKSRWCETEALVSSPPPIKTFGGNLRSPLTTCGDKLRGDQRGSSLCNEIPAPRFNRSGTSFAGMTGNDNKYINGVVKIETELAPRGLLAKLQEIEAGLGRVRTDVKWEPRTIDLDILFYDDLIIDEPCLKIPHPELHKRMFVLEPLCDIEPKLLHPVLKKTIAVIASERR